MREDLPVDVIVLGAGFAGITAARGIKNSGASVTVLEARDRIGGRAWTSELDGSKIEYGATWIHWMQPYVWAEFQRSGLELHEDPWFPPMTLHRNGASTSLEFDDFREKLQRGWESFARSSADGHLIERPYDLENLADAESLDQLSVEDAVTRLGLDDVTRDILLAEIAVQMNAHPADVSFLSQLRWWSASGWSLPLMIDCLARYKIDSGMSSLIEHMAQTAELDVRLEHPVAGVNQRNDLVEVTLTDGSKLHARCVVCALPLNCIKEVEFQPPLNAEKLALSKEEHAAKGMKVLFKTSGEAQGHAVLAPPGEKPINLLNPIRIEGDERLYVGFGTDGTAFDANDIEQVNQVLANLHPELKATACAGHDWHNDEYSLGTWHMPRPGQNIRTLRAFAEPEGSVYFAGDYLGKGWMGFVDGAIESGTLTADAVILDLKSKNAVNR